MRLSMYYQKCGHSSAVERRLPKPDVASSSLAARSKNAGADQDAWRLNLPRTQPPKRMGGSARRGPVLPRPVLQYGLQCSTFTAGFGIGHGQGCDDSGTGQLREEPGIKCPQLLATELQRSILRFTVEDMHDDTPMAFSSLSFAPS